MVNIKFKDDSIVNHLGKPKHYQIEALSNPNDAVIGISTSRNSQKEMISQWVEVVEREIVKEYGARVEDILLEKWLPITNLVSKMLEIHKSH